MVHSEGEYFARIDLKIVIKFFYKISISLNIFLLKFKIKQSEENWAFKYIPTPYHLFR